MNVGRISGSGAVLELNKLPDGDVQISNDSEAALLILKRVSEQMVKLGLNPSKWWHPDNMNAKFFSNYAEPEDFWVLSLNGEPIAAQILQFNQRNQDWSPIDKGDSPPAIYIHWLCVVEEFWGKGVSEALVDFAVKLGSSKGAKLVRVDTNAKEKKLSRIYERLGFKLAGIVSEDYRETAFYQREC